MYTLSVYKKNSVATLKAVYFLLYAAIASWATYFYVFLETERNLSATQIGILAATQQIVNIFILPWWGMVADKVGRRKVYLGLLGITMFLLYGFLIQGNFLFYFIFVIAFSILNNPIASLVDSFAIDKSKEKNIEVSYGQMRLWASLGWGFSSVLTGLLVKQTSLQYVFFIASILMAITWIVSFLNLSKKRDIRNTVTLSFSSIIIFLKQHRTLFIFFLFIMLYYILNSPTLMFVNLYYTEIGASNFQIGIAFFVQSLFEIPFMFLGKRIIERFGSINVILFTMFIASVRMVLYGFTNDPEIAILIGVLHGITLGLFLVAVIEYTHTIVPKAYNATGQSLLYTFLGIGTCIGNLSNGYLKDTISLQHAMKFNAVGIVILIGVAYYILKRKKIGLKHL